MSMLEARYFVAKISDAQAVLCDEELATLERLIRKVDYGRRANGKSSLTCVVVEEDWPNWQQTVDSVLSLADGKDNDWTNATPEQIKAFWVDDSVWKTLDGRDKWIEDLDLLVDGSPVASEWEPFGLESGQSVVIRGGWIEGNALSDDGVPLVQAFVAWKQGQDNH